MDKVEEQVMEMMTNRGLLNGVDSIIIGEIRDELNQIIKSGR